MGKSKWELVKNKLPLIEAWCRDGLIEVDIAKKLGVSKSSFDTYKKQHPNLLSALKRGKEVIDYEVESSLLKSALGFKYIDQVVTHQGDVVNVEKFQPPSNTAQIFWLKNRKPKEWRDKQELEVNGNMVIFNGENDLKD